MDFIDKLCNAYDIIIQRWKDKCASVQDDLFYAETVIESQRETIVELKEKLENYEKSN